MIYCDKCGNEFTPKIKERNRDASVKEAYFKCPRCNKHYTAFFMNQEGRRLQRVIKANPQDYAAKNKLAAIMDDLKLKYDR